MIVKDPPGYGRRILHDQDTGTGVLESAAKGIELLVA
jgi:hypothetical protein